MVGAVEVSAIFIASSDEEIARCFPVMQQLRTHLQEEEFVQRVRKQFADGYVLAALEEGGTIRSVAGYRLINNLASGRVLYVDDLVSDSCDRSRGYGGRLLEWLVSQARGESCDTVELDSGVQRYEAHRFYLVNRMIISSYHFRLKL
jgi:hypothetical protein